MNRESFEINFMTTLAELIKTESLSYLTHNFITKLLVTSIQQIFTSISLSNEGRKSIIVLMKKDFC